jgi:hypothetical protein
MRGCDEMQEGLFTVAKLEELLPADHPLWPLRELTNALPSGSTGYLP